jgi:hypothetical protein
MSDTTNTTTDIVPVQAMREQLPALLEKNIPFLEKYSAKADAALDEILQVTSDQEAEDANDILAAVRDVHNAMVPKRMEMTKITDAFKDVLMEYERPFDPKNDKSKYSQKRKLIEKYNQEKHDKLQKEKAELAKKTAVENYKVDLRAKMLENLSTMIVDLVKKSDSASRAFFEKATVADFDKLASDFQKHNPKLKKEIYDGCFSASGLNEELLKSDEFLSFRNEVQKEETYDKWNAMFLESVSPIINEWRAKIPDLKAQLIEVAELAKKNQQAADDLKAKQKKESEDQEKQRQQQLDTVAEEAKKTIQEDANFGKMTNNLAAQGAQQNIGEAGRTKLVLKFSDPKLAPKALFDIMYHVMNHPDFQSYYPVFQKRDKSKKLVYDDKQRPEYIDAVQFWIDFFLANCNAAVPGTIVTEDAKVVIKR